MKIISSVEECGRLCRTWKDEGQSVALVPTMGYFHEGHLSLMSWARENADRVIVSLFVNPTQFGQSADLEGYPRDLERDAELAGIQGVDALFAPSADAMYHPDHATWVEVPDLGASLCGASRPGHFRGVCTVVSKLLHLCGPDRAVFGEKDWQQLAIIRRMVRDLMIPVEIVGRPTVREVDGLAMSSRNVRLKPEEREQAPNLYQGLSQARELAKRGMAATQLVRMAVLAMYEERISEGRLDYLEFVNGETLEPVSTVIPGTLAAVAWNFSNARLIDNILVS